MQSERYAYAQSYSTTATRGLATVSRTLVAATSSKTPITIMEQVLMLYEGAVDDDG